MQVLLRAPGAGTVRLRERGKISLASLDFCRNCEKTLEVVAIEFSFLLTIVRHIMHIIHHIRPEVILIKMLSPKTLRGTITEAIRHYFNLTGKYIIVFVSMWLLKSHG